MRTTWDLNKLILRFVAARYEVSQINSQLNALLKEIGKKKKVSFGFRDLCVRRYSPLTDYRKLEQGRRKPPFGG